jgi:hypothetical protein
MANIKKYLKSRINCEALDSVITKIKSESKWDRNNKINYLLIQKNTAHSKARCSELCLCSLSYPECSTKLPNLIQAIKKIKDD